MFRDILVHVDGRTAGRRRVKYAFDLATRHCARVTGLHVTPPVEVPARFKPSLVADAEGHILEKLELDSRAAEAIFRQEGANRLPERSWLRTDGEVAAEIAAHARYSDIVIVGQYERQGSPECHPLPVAHPVHLKCGCPVLVVPASVQPRPPERIAVAWDGNREAARTVHDALPLLRQARSVRLMTVNGTSPGEEWADDQCLSAHLANHGVNVEPGVHHSRNAKDHELFLQGIEPEDFDLLVMGGYSRPMWREFLFGGTTQSILLTSRIPVLVSH